MFVGSVPQPVVEQILRVAPRSWWTEAYVCCSGSFRVDAALKAKWRDLKVHSNDISLLSVALGQLALRQHLPVTFTGRLFFVEEFLALRRVVDALGQQARGNQRARLTFRARCVKSTIRARGDTRARMKKQL